MSFVVVKCPECGYSKVVNGRGRCRCGAYLNHHQGRGTWAPAGDRCYVWQDERWVPTNELPVRR